MPDHVTTMTQSSAMERAYSAGSVPSHRASRISSYDLGVDPDFAEGIRRFTEEKRRVTMRDDEDNWRDSIKLEMEAELDRRVREALEANTPQRIRPSGFVGDPPSKATHTRDMDSLEQLNAHIDLSMRDREAMNQRRWKLLQAKRKLQRMMSHGELGYGAYRRHGNDREPNAEELEMRRQIEYDDLIGAFNENDVQGDDQQSRSHDFYSRLAKKAANDFANLSNTEKIELFYMFTKNGFRDVMKNGCAFDGSGLEMLEGGKLRDKFGVVRDQHGPFWPADYGPMYPAPKHKTETTLEKCSHEPMINPDNQGL